MNHCPKNGVSLGTGELPVPDVSAAVRSIQDPGAGLRRGYIIDMHGLDNAGIQTTYPLPIPNSGSSGFYDRTGDFSAAVVTDGWLFVYPNYQEDFYTGAQGGVGLFNDVSNDSGHGSRYSNSSARWCDHLIRDLDRTYHSHGAPIILMGWSWGGIRTLRILTDPAFQSKSRIIGYIVHDVPTICEGISRIFTAGVNFYSIDWSGYDLTPTFLSTNNITIPGIWGYGTVDEAVAYDGTTTVAGGSDGVDVSTLNGSGPLFVNSNATMVTSGNPPLVKVQTTNGFAYILFVGLSAGQLNSAQTLAGSGTIHTGNTVVQSYQLQCINDALAHSLPLTVNATANTHELTGTPSGAGNDAAVYAAWVASTMDSRAPANAF